ncbi:MAG: T9SS type A sorting domain-containing protein [Flavobacteriales bacterium]|nr:T9SS type A sorting domain-containing protein [Flavobacteriales bacterium]
MAAHAQSIRYSNFYDSNSGAEILAEAITLNDGSLMIAGVTSNANGSGYGKVLNMVVAEDGTLQYSHVWEEIQASVVPYAIVRTWNGGIYEAGTKHDYSVSSSGTGDFFLAKLDETGDTLFTKVIERPDTSDFLLDMVQTSPNKLLLIGWTYNDTVAVSSAAQLLFITTDTLGNELNRIVWGGGGTDYVHSGVVVNDQGDVVMTGYTKSFPSASTGRTWVIRTDSIGNVKWHRTYNGVVGIGSSAARVSLLPDGNVLVAGGNSTFGSSNFGGDGSLMKIDTTGNQIWAKEYEMLEGQGLWDCKGLADGTIVSCGVSVGDDGSQAGWLIKTDENGDTLWTRTYNPSSLIDFIRFMLVMPNGDIVMLGNGRAPGQTIQDGWVLRVDSNGCLVEGCYGVGIEEEEKDEEFSVYPNPATDILNIKLADHLTTLTITITDITGRAFPLQKHVLSNVEVGVPAGRGIYSYDVSTWPNGIYLITITDQDGNRSTKRLVVQH